LGWLFTAPALVVLAVAVGYPMLLAIWYSFHQKLFGLPADFVGLENFLANLEDPRFRNAVATTLIYTVVAVTFKCCIGFAVALLLNREFPLRAVLRSLILLSWALPEIAVVLGWNWLLNSEWGALNVVLTRLGLIDQNIYWLSDPALVLPTVIAVDVWRTFPFFTIVILAGLQNINKELYEAAAVDGASAVRRFWHITLPQVVPVLSVALVLATIWNLNDFATIWFLTRGGPGSATEVLSIYTYQVAFSSLNDLGRAASVSTLAMPLLALLIVVLVKVSKRREAEV
jgi:multiple sugar transport system permease protein